MQARVRALPQRQHGSIYSTVIVVALFAIFLTSALKVAPAYMDDRLVAATMEQLVSSRELPAMSAAEIRDRLVQRLGSSNVKLDADELHVGYEPGSPVVDIDYERHIPLFFNITAVLSFRHRVEKE
jgi:hypothetical protein